MSTHALSRQSVLLKPIAWQGQPYFTTQYFHQQYLMNSQYGGKYQRHDSFVRLLRSIHAYEDYVGQGDIVELEWGRIKTEGTPIQCSFKPLFQAAGWNPLTLLNATAQVAMTHHLDDELSRRMSVAANTSVAQQGSGGTFLDQYPEMRAIVDQAKAVIALATQQAETRARLEMVEANTQRLLETQQFFTVAEYLAFEHLGTKIQSSEYRGLSDHLRMFCLDRGIPFRRIAVGGQRWDSEYGFHISVWAELLPAWLRQRDAQPTLYALPSPGASRRKGKGMP